MRVLIADSSERVRETLIRYLDLENKFEMVFEADGVNEAIRIMTNIRIELVILDIQLNDLSGLELVNFCKRQLHKPMVVVCSNYGMPQYKNVYEKLSIDHYFDKSSEMPELKKFIKRIVIENNNKYSGSSFNISSYHQ